MQNSITLPPPICNIALIGQSNYLKSVALNALPNYLKNSSSEHVNELISLVPVNVNFFNREKCENVSIPLGEDIVELTNCHLLLHQTRVYRLIDLPEDELKLSAIYKHCDTLHGILYLITSEQLGDSEDFFEDTFKPLLAELETFTNVTFCFTFNYQPNYDIPAIKQTIENDLMPFNIQLRDGLNCFHIDCEPFVFLLASESYKPTTQNKLFWTKSHETACEIFYKIAHSKPYNLSHNLIARDSKLFFNAIKKAVTNLEKQIKLKQIEIETETKRLQAFNNKNRNYYRSILNEIKCIPGQIKEYLDELNILEIETFEFTQFIVTKFNNRESAKLIPPFILEFVSKNSWDIQENNELIKAETNETTQNENVQNGQNFKDLTEFNRQIDNQKGKVFNSLAKLSKLNFSGQYLNNNFIYFEAKQSIHPSLTQILELMEPVVKILKEVKETENLLAKLIQEIQQNENTIRLTCSVHFNYRDGGAATFSCYKECGCTERDIVLNAIGHPSVEKCKTIDSRTKLCTRCARSWEEHAHRKSKLLKKPLSDRLKEFNVVQNVAVQFDYLLLAYSQKSLTDYMDLYFNAQPVKNNDESLSQFKEYYRQNVLPKFWPNKKVNLPNIPQLCDQLYKLKFKGSFFREYKDNLNNNVNELEVEQDVPTSSTSSE